MTTPIDVKEGVSIDINFLVAIIIARIMTMKRFILLFAAPTRNHMRFIERQYHSLIQKVIEMQLVFEPNIENRNRKPLDPASRYGDWEIRFGPGNSFRVFYTVDEAAGVVHILAIGEKRGNRLFIGGEEELL